MDKSLKYFEAGLLAYILSELAGDNILSWSATILGTLLFIMGWMEVPWVKKLLRRG